MNYPLLKLTNYLSNIKRKLARGVVADKMQEELSSIMDSECNLHLSYITGQPYPCRKRHEISYHYVITSKSDKWTIQFILIVLKDGKRELDIQILFDEMRNLVE